MKNDSLAPDWNGGPDAPVGPGAPVTEAEWHDELTLLRHYANRIQTLLNNRARKICADAGLDPNLLGIHPHNAMCGLASGNPWSEVDYNRVQAVQDLLAHEFDGNRIVDVYDKAVRIDPHARWLKANPPVVTPEQEAALDEAIKELEPLLGF